MLDQRRILILCVIIPTKINHHFQQNYFILILSLEKKINLMNFYEQEYSYIKL